MQGRLSWTVSAVWKALPLWPARSLSIELLGLLALQAVFPLLLVLALKRVCLLPLAPTLSLPLALLAVLVFWAWLLSAQIVQLAVYPQHHRRPAFPQ